MFRKMKEALASAGVLSLIALILALVPGWITNIWWMSKATTLGDIAFGAVGIFVFPIGALHGIYLWF